MKKLLFLLFFSIVFLTACEEKTIIDGVDLSSYTKAEVSTSFSTSGAGITISLKIDDVALNGDETIYLVIDESIYEGTFIGVVAGSTLFSVVETVDEDDWSDPDLDNLIHAYYSD